MIARRAAAALTVVALALPFGLARADHEPDRWGCPIHVDDASASLPHASDATGDWEGLVLGNESATIPAGDVYREGTDIVAAWISRDAGGSLRGHIQVADLLIDAQPNAIFYLFWSYPGTVNPSRARRWVSGRLKGYDVAFSYGYQGPTPLSDTALITEGETTGTVDAEANTITVDIPSGGVTLTTDESNDDWGAPPTGARLRAIVAESRLLVGSPEPLPSNPANLRHGYVFLADTSENGPACDALVNSR